MANGEKHSTSDGSDGSKLGLGASLYREIIAGSIGVHPTDLPKRVEENLELVGLFRAKQLSFELLHAIRETRTAIKRMRIKLANREPTDDDWALIQYEYAEVWAERDLLRSRIDEDCANWTQYTQVAEPIYRRLDEFCAAIRKIAQGYVPRGMQAVGESHFPKAPPLTCFADKVDYYLKSIEAVWVMFADWLRDCGDLYSAHCELLNRPF